MGITSTESRWRRWLSPLVYLSSNWLSLTGVVVITTATVLWLFLLPTTLRGETAHPYVGIFAFLLLPAVFFSGLVLIPLGIWWRRRSALPVSFPPLDFHNVELRRLVAFVGVTTIANFIIGSQVTYAAVSYMDSVTFCGLTCHRVMEPEYTAHQNSPHARVACVACHIGPGASWFVRSKLSGTGQVFATLFDTYPRPIPVPVQDLRPARETCETCHWPEKFDANRLNVIARFAEDEANTMTQTVLLMRIGGGMRGTGIHGKHMRPGVTVRYAASDEERQKIPWIEYSDKYGTTVYASPGTKPNNAAALPIRQMDCIDCHNRPTHTFQLPERAVDEALAAGSISPVLPFAKKESVAILRSGYASTEEAAARIPRSFFAFYQQAYPSVYQQHTAEIENSARSLLAIYRRNVFPSMNVTWGTYPNNIGHTDFPGCFRCHDGNHTSASGSSITQDCSACHNMIAVEESSPKILSDLGISEKDTLDPK